VRHALSPSPNGSADGQCAGYHRQFVLKEGQGALAEARAGAYFVVETECSPILFLARDHSLEDSAFDKR
jgi:hypothetical protein